MLARFAGVVPSICPFKYDPPSLIGYQLLANVSTPRVKCEASFQELMNANGYWREMGVKLHVDLRVCGGLEVKGTDFANCDPRDDKFWHVNTTLTLERDVSCFTMALKSRGKDKVYHENGKSTLWVQTCVMPHFPIRKDCESVWVMWIRLWVPARVSCPTSCRGHDRKRHRTWHSWPIGLIVCMNPHWVQWFKSAQDLVFQGPSQANVENAESICQVASGWSQSCRQDSELEYPTKTRLAPMPHGHEWLAH